MTKAHKPADAITHVREEDGTIVRYPMPGVITTTVDYGAGSTTSEEPKSTPAKSAKSSKTKAVDES